MSIRFRGYRVALLERARVGKVRSEAPPCVELRSALCVPLVPLPGQGPRLRGGVFDGSGAYVTASGLVTNGYTILGPGAEPVPSPLQTLPGRTLYLGLCHYHYGHFLTETLSRLWCFDRGALTAFHHILLLPLNGQVPAFAWDLFHAVGIADRIRVVTVPTALEEVCIPAPAIGYPGRVHRQVTAIPALFDADSAVRASDQPLFLSRTAVVPGHSRVLIGENWVERALAAQGVRVLHPQRHTVLEQIAALRSHRTVISFAGSALHTLIPAGGGLQVLAYTARTVPAVFPLLDLALGNQATYIRAGRKGLKGLASMKTGFNPQLIDPRSVLAELRDAGVIGTYDLSGYGAPEIDAGEARRYNTALLLRRVLEAGQGEDDRRCRAEIDAFRQRYALDAALNAQATEGSTLMRRYFSVGNDIGDEAGPSSR